MNKCCSSLEDEFPFDINKDSNPYLSTDKEVTPLKQTNEPNVYVKITFISQVSYYINQIKQECKEFEQYRKSLNSEISVLENKKSTLENNNRELVEKNNNILAHLKWYDFLKQELSNYYNLNLDIEIMSFSSIINDFKMYNYNIIDILKEYKQIQTLRKERQQIKIDIELNAPLQRDLLQQIESSNSQLDFSRQTMKIYHDLSAMGFDLKKLRQLHGMIIEILLANNMSVMDPVTKFLNDIENQYDSKLGLETEIKKLIAKKGELENEIPHYKSNLLIQSQMVQLLSYLVNNGVTYEDIINMGQLVVSLQDSNFLTNSLSQGANIANGIGNTNTKKITKNESWKLLIDKLRSIQNLDSEIEKLTIHKNELRSEFTLLQIEKSKIEGSNQDPYPD